MRAPAAGARRRLDRGSMELQRGERGARHPLLSHSGGRRRRPRKRFHHRRLRRRPARADADRRGRARNARETRALEKSGGLCALPVARDAPAPAIRDAVARRLRQAPGAPGGAPAPLARIADAAAHPARLCPRPSRAPLRGAARAAAGLARRPRSDRGARPRLQHHAQRRRGSAARGVPGARGRASVHHPGARLPAEQGEEARAPIIARMAHRLSKITTRTGDRGETGLGDGSRVSKDSLRVRTLGDLDELNSAIGLVLAESPPTDVSEALSHVQHDLFDLGGEISIPGHALLGDAQVERLEATIESWNAELPALKEFILPGGTRAAAAAHLARTVCRRAERAVVALGEKEKVSEPARRYLNRLSDLLFIAGRRLNRHAGGTDVQWRHERKKQR